MQHNDSITDFSLHSTNTMHQLYQRKLIYSIKFLVYKINLFKPSLILFSFILIIIFFMLKNIKQGNLIYYNDIFY